MWSFEEIGQSAVITTKVIAYIVNITLYLIGMEVLHL